MLKVMQQVSSRNGIRILESQLPNLPVLIAGLQKQSSLLYTDTNRLDFTRATPGLHKLKWKEI